MTDAILVLNAGSSSLKVTEFTIGADGAPAAALNLTFEELTGDARFRATDPTGRVIEEHRWAEGEAPGHGAALDFLTDWLRELVSLTPSVGTLTSDQRRPSACGTRASSPSGSSAVDGGAGHAPNGGRAQDA